MTQGIVIDDAGAPSIDLRNARRGVLLRRLLLGVAVTAFFALFAGAWLAFLWIEANRSEDEPVGGSKVFSRVLGEEFFVRNPKEKAPRMSCRKCQVEKMRLGHLSLGGVNVLNLEDLVLNIPPDGFDMPPAAAAEADKPSVQTAGQTGSGRDGEAPSDWMSGFSALPALAGGGRQKRFSAVRISGLAVKLMTATGVAPVFDAASAHNEGRDLELKKCRIFAAGATNHVRTAVLKLGKKPFLKWKHGRFDILKGGYTSE